MFSAFNVKEIDQNLNVPENLIFLVVDYVVLMMLFF